MTTKERQMATECSHCSASEAARAAAVAEAAAWDREALVAVQHGIWSSWMRWMFDCGDFNDDGTWVMPANKAQRWCRQANTSYAGLSDEEKESDRHQADKVIAVLPAVAALEQRLARAVGTEERLRLLIEHHREHHTIEERWLARAAQLEEELAAVDEALGEFYMSVLDEHDEPCGAFYKDHGVNVMRQALEQKQESYEALYSFALKSNEIVGQEMDELGERVKQLEARLSRAEALAALVPEVKLLQAAGSCLLELLCYDTPGTLDITEMAGRLRALAARIEEAKERTDV